MEDKITTTRNYILDLLESGSLKGGDKLPGARVIASSIKVSFLKIQQALDNLAQDGILETISRKGTFVQRNWEDRILQTNFTLFNRDLPWIDGFEKLLAARIPQLRVCRKFPQSVFELRTTLHVQNNRNDYLDLQPFFDRIYPDKSLFFSHPFKNFYVDRKLAGIPFIFSPRVIFYNPDLLKNFNCPEPHSGWTWEEFIQSVRKMRAQKVPGTEIFNWFPEIFQWMNIVFRAGGCLISSSPSDPVAIDHPRTRHGLQLYTELMHELNVSYNEVFSDCTAQFASGKLAFMLSERESLAHFRHAGFDGWKTVPLPVIEGGSDITAQATDLICVRKNCSDPTRVEDFVRFMLSEETQDFIGMEKYGIPIRKSSAFKSIDAQSPRDMLFLSETNKISAQYNISSPEMSSMIEEGIKCIWRNDLDMVQATGALAQAIRLFLHIKQVTKNNILIRNKEVRKSEEACLV
ncbi:MAG: extracellular solute-binding protein [Victivallaceae bacterium]|jgi:ABC-type glycerol-3-phosphate transport system substrate-binding protein/DNA-binding transcriptional regulator YhcF (GntR family)